MSIPIYIVAAVIRDQSGRLLLVRKRGTTKFMQPGGKIEPSELKLAALAREIREELGCSMMTDTARYLGEFRAPSANEPSQDVEADIFEVQIVGEPVPQAEIDAIVWLDTIGGASVELAPLTRDCVIPMLASSPFLPNV
jgi:8-oxo-dGTP diphosphatase